VRLALSYYMCRTIRTVCTSLGFHVTVCTSLVFHVTVCTSLVFHVTVCTSLVFHVTVCTSLVFHVTVCTSFVFHVPNNSHRLYFGFVGTFDQGAVAILPCGETDGSL
jgi:hypothetical protein